MDSLKELYKIGCGPSSSHTMGPERAAKALLQKFPHATHYKVELWGSLAATGKGHLTDWIIIKTLEPRPVEIIWKPRYVHPFHTNGILFTAFAGDEILVEQVVFSVGGGSIKMLEDIEQDQTPTSTGEPQTYPLQSLSEIMERCHKEQQPLRAYVEHCEGPSIRSHLTEIAAAMESAVLRGLEKDGLLPGPLKLPRKAKEMYQKALHQPTSLAFTNKIFAYALAVAEENASAGRIVTAPTCGSAGVIPGLLQAMKEEYHLSQEEVLRGLAIGGLIGNLIKHNATISGAEGGCQAEIGAACSMASAMAVYWLGGSLAQIEYAAESGMEHHLGMTCDPVGGYVQIPCIERNAIVAARSLNTANYCMSTSGEHVVSFDAVVQTMKETGRDMCSAYKETSLGGLAKHYEELLIPKEHQENGS